MSEKAERHPYLCVCGHSSKYHRDGYVPKKGQGHPCFMPGCICTEFKVLMVIPPPDVKEAVAEALQYFGMRQAARKERRKKQRERRRSGAATAAEQGKLF